MRTIPSWRSRVVVLQCISVWTVLFLWTVSMHEVTSSETQQNNNDVVAEIIQSLESDGTSLPNRNKNIIESIWKTFKQKFDTSPSAASIHQAVSAAGGFSSPKQQPHQQHGDEQAALRAQRQKDELVNRRTLLFHKTIRDHYTQQLFQSTLATTAAAPIQRNDPHSHNPQQQPERRRHQKRRPSVDQPPPPSALRWQQSSAGGGETNVNDPLCYCFTESSGSYWSFQWCPHHEIFQGRLNPTDGYMHAFHSVGKYDGGSQYPTSSATALALTQAAASRYPHALSIDVYDHGDPCGERHQSNTNTAAMGRRIAIVVVHDSVTSERCSFADAAFLQDDEEYAIERVDELRTCQYMIHVCQKQSLSSSSSEDSKTSHNTDATPPSGDDGMLWDVSSLSDTDATLLNRTIQAAQRIATTYQHETHVDSHLRSTADVLTSLSTGLPPMPPSRIRTNLQLIKDMFMHAYDSYMYHGYPSSEVKPMTCKPAIFNLVKIPGVTLIDSLDTLILMNNYTEFARAVERLRYLNDHVTEVTGMFSTGGLFAINQNVSVFETNIRVLGGLLSAHQLAEAYVEGKVLEQDVHADDGSVLIGAVSNCISESGQRTDQNNFVKERDCSADGMGECQAMKPIQKACNTTNSKQWKYDGFLLDLAQDIGDRLLPAYKTQTGIPFGTVNLLSGVPKGETTIASLAGGGTLSLEMELLGRLTGEERYGRAAKLAARALWMRRSPMDLFGKHIDTRSGDWTEYLSGIGSNSDSFYEYQMKHHILFPEDDDFWLQFISAYSGIHEQSRLGEWYADVDMRAGGASSGASRRVFEALMAFYPGLQALAGEHAPAARTLNSFFLVREYLGFLPERFNYGNWKVDSNGGIHLLRPEILESAYFLHRASKGLKRQRGSELNASIVETSSWQWAGDFAVHTIESLTRSQCGYASPRDVSPSITGAINAEKERVRLSNEMPSYFLSETLKYLYLLFDENNAIHTDDDRDWVFTTEAHPFTYETKLTSKLEAQTKALRERLERRLNNNFDARKMPFPSLKYEKWTHTSDEKSFREQLDAMDEDAHEIYANQRLYDIDYDSRSEYAAHLVEPVLPQETLFGALDTFNERLYNGNPAYLSFRDSGNSVDLTMSCPNLHQSDLLWIGALNGGVTEYSQVYMSRVQDEVSVPNFRAGYLGSIDALALIGSGLHISSVFDADSVCPIRGINSVDPKNKSDDNTGKGHQQKQQGSSRLEMGGMGTFEVSAFPEGSGFLVQHVQSGETIVTTLLNDAETESDEVPVSYVLVYNRESTDPDSQRSVVMADLHGNAFSCVVELIDKTAAIGEDAVCVTEDGGPDCCPSSVGRDGDRTVARFPCAPALFGPTRVSNMNNGGTISVEAIVQSPVLGEEYGCSKERGRLEPSRSSGDDTLGVDEDVCENISVSLVHRGICTFQEKSMNQKTSLNAQGIIVINSEDDELFVMSGSGPDESPWNDADFPVTVLVTGMDGQSMLDIIESHASDQDSPLYARISFVKDEAGLLQTQSGLSIVGNKLWPAVLGGSEAIQIFSRSGWGVHASQRQRQDHSGELEWQLLLMTHNVDETL